MKTTTTNMMQEQTGDRATTKVSVAQFAVFGLLFVGWMFVQLQR